MFFGTRARTPKHNDGLILLWMYTETNHISRSFCGSVSCSSADEVLQSVEALDVVFESRDKDGGRGLATMPPVSVRCRPSLLPIASRSADRSGSVTGSAGEVGDQSPVVARAVLPPSAAPSSATSSSASSNFRYFHQMAPLLSDSAASCVHRTGQVFLFADDVVAVAMYTVLY